MNEIDPAEYGDDIINRRSLDKLYEAAELSELDIEILELKIGKGWTFAEVADEIGRKFLGRTNDNPLWEGSIRHRLRGIMARLRKSGLKVDYL